MVNGEHDGWCLTKCAAWQQSVQDITAHIRARMQTVYHPVGTCKMGTHDMAVVGPQLRVHGLEDLRVVGASIMPTIPRGNTNASTIAVAKQAADLIRGLTAAAASLLGRN